MSLPTRILRGDLQLGKLIAQQKFSSVFAGTLGGQQVAVKRSSSGLLENESVMLSKVCTHPHVLTMHGVCEDEDGAALLVTELATGALPGYMQANRQNWSPKYWEPVLLQVAQAMAHLHAQDPPMLHRDCKPSNIFLHDHGSAGSPRPEVFLADFDRAAELPGKGAQLTEPAGSILHMSPEELRWEPYGTAADVYSFGMLAFELMQQSPPFLGKMAPGIPGALTAAEFAEAVGGETSMRPTWYAPAPTPAPTHAPAPAPTPCAASSSTGGGGSYRELVEQCWHREVARRPSFADILRALPAMACGGGDGAHRG
jgi:serine/threonine protein kinase